MLTPFQLLQFRGLKGGLDTVHICLVEIKQTQR